MQNIFDVCLYFLLLIFSTLAFTRYKFALRNSVTCAKSRMLNLGQYWVNFWISPVAIITEQ